MNLNQSEAPPRPLGSDDELLSSALDHQLSLHRRLARAVGVSTQKVSNALFIERMELIELQGGEL